MNFRAKSRKDDFDIDLMPLIDVVFLLLIFFLITTSFTQQEDEQQKIPINLPTGVTGTNIGEGTKVVLFVTESGDIEFDTDIELEGTDLKSKLQSLKSQRPDADILIKGDTAASHGNVVETLDTIQSAGFDKVDLVISKTAE